MRRNQNGNRDMKRKWKKGEKTEKETSQFVTVKSFFNTQEITFLPSFPNIKLIHTGLN